MTPQPVTDPTNAALLLHAALARARWMTWRNRPPRVDGVLRAWFGWGVTRVRGWWC